MAFINEYISNDDRVKYNLESIDVCFVVGGAKSKSWTIDRERDIYLRTVARGREDLRHESTWIFYWKGELLVLELDNISTSGVVGGHRQGHKKIRSLELPDQLKIHYQEILDDLKEALSVYKDGGIFATSSTYSLILDVE